MFPNHFADFWKISLHNKDAYVPGIQGIFGSAFILTPLGVPNETIVALYSISKDESTYLNLGDDDSCLESATEEFHYGDCLAAYIESELGCRQVDMFNTLIKHRDICF